MEDNVSVKHISDKIMDPAIAVSLFYDGEIISYKKIFQRYSFTATRWCLREEKAKINCTKGMCGMIKVWWKEKSFQQC